jgi:hypothetical protein
MSPNTFQVDGTLIDIYQSRTSYFLFSLSSVLDSRIIIFTTSYDDNVTFGCGCGTSVLIRGMVIFSSCGTRKRRRITV